MAKIKGSFFTALKAFIQDRFSQDGWSRFVEAMPEKERIQFEMPVSGKWYDLELAHASLRALVEVLGDGSEELAADFGRFDAERDLTGVQRFFLRMANPAYTIEKAGEYWNRFCDFGEWKIERRGKSEAAATLSGVPLVEKLYCRQLGVYLVRMFELVGAKDIQVEHTSCLARGDQVCTWVGSWKE